jgi:hypothetical protein
MQKTLSLKYITGDIQLFLSKNGFLTASPSPFPCIKITWTA